MNGINQRQCQVVDGWVTTALTNSPPFSMVLVLFRNSTQIKIIKDQAAGLLDRFMGRVTDDNFKLTGLDGKITLWVTFALTYNIKNRILSWYLWG